jgi:hypothetical protein
MIEVLKQTVKALELVSTEFVCNGAHHAKKDRHQLGEPCPIVGRYEEAIQAGKQAIAELENQEPVCNKDPQGCWNVRCQLGKMCKNTPSAAQPAQRTWVGLTDEEIWEAYMESPVELDCSTDELYALSRTVEAKLKEKNT